MNPVYIKINEYGDRYYYSDAAMTKLHRTDGPAIESATGAKFWYVNDQLHRTDGPACEYANGSNVWRLNGKLHRTDGPAFEYHDGYKAWYLNGKQLSEAEFLKATATEVVLTLDMIAAKFGVSVENLKIAK